MKLFKIEFTDCVIVKAHSKEDASFSAETSITEYNQLNPLSWKISEVESLSDLPVNWTEFQFPYTPGEDERQGKTIGEILNPSVGEDDLDGKVAEIDGVKYKLTKV